MRVALFVHDDSAAECLGPLAARGCQVLGIAYNAEPFCGAASCSIFARRCVELGFNFSTASSDEGLLKLLVENFKPDVMVNFSTGQAAPKAFQDATSTRKYVLRVGVSMPGSPWPEFAPLWLGHGASPVVLEKLTTSGATAALASASVPLTPGDTAVTLRMKHAEQAARLLATALERSADEEVKDHLGPTVTPITEQAPSTIALEWDQPTVERFIRAMSFPPHDPAVVADPGSEDKYFIENIEQYKEFRRLVLTEKRADADNKLKTYAADTHWYSNVGGSIVKMGDSDIHKPIKITDRKRRSVIPGAAIGTRKKLRMNEPLIGPNAERYSSSALASGWIGVEGPYVKQFEKQLATICGCSAACAVQSGTAALYGAIKALGVSDPSHHVLVPSFTCAAAADAVVHAGGQPIPVDCELDSYGLSLKAVREALASDKDVVGVVLAPCYGVPARDAHEILALCKERGLWLCEDACETYGAMKGPGGGVTSKVPVGSTATLCVVSVRSEKMIGVGEGGAILGNDTTLVARAKWWCSRAPTCGAGLWRVYEHDAVGQNFRMPEMLAAVGCAAAEMLPVMIERKRAIHDWYTAQFASHSELEGVRLQESSDGDEPVWWINAALLPEGMNGEEVGMLLMKDYPDIEIRPGFFPLNKMGIFQSEWNQPCPNSELLYSRLVCLPSSNQLVEADIERISAALAASITKVRSGSSSVS